MRKKEITIQLAIGALEFFVGGFCPEFSGRVIANIQTRGSGKLVLFPEQNFRGVMRRVDNEVGVGNICLAGVRIPDLLFICTDYREGRILLKMAGRIPEPCRPYTASIGMERDGIIGVSEYFQTLAELYREIPRIAAGR